MERIGPNVSRQLARFGGRGSMPRVIAVWASVVGGPTARHSCPARIARDGTLHVHTSSSVWAFELGQLAPVILERLQHELGEDAPGALRFSQGHVPEPPPPAAIEGEPAPCPPSQEALDKGAELAAGITAP